MDFLTNAFKSLANLNEEVFDLSIGGENQELKDFLDNDEEIDTLTIIDDEAENEEELEDSYMGKVILDCNVCHSLIYKNPEDVVLDGDVANIEEECPYCYSQDGYKIVGQVKPFEQSEEDAEEAELEDEPEDESDEEESEESEEEVETEEPEDEEDDDDLEESFKNRGRSLTEGIPTVTSNNNDKVKKALQDIYKQVAGLTDKINNKLKGVDDRKLEKVREFVNRKVHNKYYDIIMDAFQLYPISRKLMLKYLTNGEEEADSVKAFREFFVTIKQKFYQLASQFKFDSSYNPSGDKDMLDNNSRFKQNAKGDNAVADKSVIDKAFAKYLGFDIDESLNESKTKTLRDLLKELDSDKPFDIIEKSFGDGDEFKNKNDKIPQSWLNASVEDVYEENGKLTIEILEESCKGDDCDEEELDEFLDFGCVNAQGQTIGLGFGGGTGISTGGSDGGLDVPGIGEELEDDDEDDEICYPDYEKKKVIRAKKSDLKKQGYKFAEDESLDEAFEKVDIETEDTHLSMDSDENGKVTVTTEPKQSDGLGEEDMSFDDDFGFGDEGGEAIGAVEMDTEEKIEDNQEPEEGEESEEGSEDDLDLDLEGEESDEGSEEESGDEEEVEEFDEESFDDLGESYLKKIYENVQSYKTTSVSEKKNRLIVEGVIKFTSGAQKKTQFIFEDKQSPVKNKIMLEGCNKQITRAKKGFALTCSLEQGETGKKIVCEKLRYRYNVNKSLVEGFVGRNK